MYRAGGGGAGLAERKSEACGAQRCAAGFPGLAGRAGRGGACWDAAPVGCWRQVAGSTVGSYRGLPQILASCGVAAVLGLSDCEAEVGAPGDVPAAAG
ncbi:hypothetical protein NDU88_008177 [Pleurodeles waltl]|uniref:Uncharacterized protein n=1 Tax=Pleurodeles waltl TaxID=8319 RepID=A0AAV7RV10_PLEWA|nr:hypothetical protein NDU88_008177 [Pleurodeles waltl]